MTQSAEDIIRGGSLPTKTVPVCMHADLTAEHEELQRQLNKALVGTRDSLAAAGNATEIAEQIAELEERMRDHTVVFKLRALPRPKWKKLVGEHPPRKAEDGTINERDRFIAVNTETFFEAMIRACTVEPQLSPEVWRVLFGDGEDVRAQLEAELGPERAAEEIEDGKLTDHQFNELADAAWALNRHDVDVPFSPAASRIRQGSASE